MPVSTDVRITVVDLSGNSKVVVVPYGTTIAGLKNKINVDKIYNYHGREIPNEVPLRGPATFKLAPVPI